MEKELLSKMEKELLSKMDKKMAELSLSTDKIFPQFQMTEPVQEDTPIANFCTGKFEPLSKYLEGITSTDFALLNEDDLVDLVDSKHRILMKLFVRKLQSRLYQNASDDPFSSDTSPSKIPQEKVLVTPKGVLDLSKEVASISVKLANTPYIPLDSLSSLYHKERGAIKVLNLSACNLVDQDLPTIAHFVSTLPNCEIVNLSNNHFHGIGEGKIKARTDKALFSLLDEKPLQYLDITINPLASVDRRDLFEKLKSTHLQKLIWIPFSWLDGRGWRTLIEPTQQNLVLETHRTYYKHTL